MLHHLRLETGASQRLRQYCSENPRHSAAQRSRRISNIKTLISQFLWTADKQPVSEPPLYPILFGPQSLRVHFSSSLSRDKAKPGFVDQCSQSSQSRESRIAASGVSRGAPWRKLNRVRNLNKGDEVIYMQISRSRGCHKWLHPRRSPRRRLYRDL